LGSIKSKEIKTISKKLVEIHPEKFSTNFISNKKSLFELNITDNKSIRNKLAGYIVHLLKGEQN
jgi:small subunit ribosomal protein S17e